MREWRPPIAYLRGLRRSSGAEEASNGDTTRSTESEPTVVSPVEAIRGLGGEGSNECSATCAGARCLQPAQAWKRSDTTRSTESEPTVVAPPGSRRARGRLPCQTPRHGEALAHHVAGLCAGLRGLTGAWRDARSRVPFLPEACARRDRRLARTRHPPPATWRLSTRGVKQAS